MGRHNLSPQRVHTHATHLLTASSSKTPLSPPPWYTTIGSIPPASRLTRPPIQRSSQPGKRKSRSLFKPVRLGYEEDKLRWEYFNDHPWELARPRVVLENDGRDGERGHWDVELDFALNRPRAGKGRDERGRTDRDWEVLRDKLAGRVINGEAVISRQQYLLLHTPSSPAAAYDTARKELYRLRHFQETETRVAREEALATGAFFGLGPNEIGMQLEDRAYEDWREWAEKEIVALKQVQGGAYTGNESEEVEQPAGERELEEVGESVPAIREGQRAEGGSAVHP